MEPWGSPGWPDSDPCWACAMRIGDDRRSPGLTAWASAKGNWLKCLGITSVYGAIATMQNRSVSVKPLCCLPSLKRDSISAVFAVNRLPGTSLQSQPYALGARLYGGMVYRK